MQVMCTKLEVIILSQQQVVVELGNGETKNRSKKEHYIHILTMTLMLHYTAVFGLLGLRVVPVRCLVIVVRGMFVLVWVAVCRVILCNLKRNGAKAE